MKLRHLVLFVSTSFAIANPATAQITPSKESLSDVYPGKSYSPYAQRSFPDQVYWGVRLGNNSRIGVSFLIAQGA